jgi:nucleoside-specific outer membrane channel protein Tsx
MQDSFGWSVAVSGSTAVVGAYFKNHSTGAAYVFVRSGTIWSQQAELTASDGARQDSFGWSVAVSGSSAVVGAYSRNSNEGAAYVFVRSGTIWSQQAELTASDGASGDFFGYSVAISGSAAVVGAQGKNSFTGAAYVFVRSGTIWSQKAKLTASDGASGDSFGHSVAISRSTAVAGAYAHNSSAGAAYAFVLGASL